MRPLLLDTHALLWALTDPGQLGSVAGPAVADSSTPLFVSAASAWELAVKNRLGKLPQADVVLTGYTSNLARLGATSLPITDDHALLAGRLDWQHRDPFDRMLAAQAMISALTLVTRDAAFATLPGVDVLW